MKTKKLTLATLKSFIRKNEGNLFVNQKSSFDGMVDCVMPVEGGFQAVAEMSEESKTRAKHTNLIERTLGLPGVWCVGQSRDYLEPYNENGFTGIEISNSCGVCIVAIKSA